MVRTNRIDRLPWAAARRAGASSKRLTPAALLLACCFFVAHADGDGCPLFPGKIVPGLGDGHHSSIATADFDGDGAADLFVAATNGDLEIAWGTGTGAFDVSYWSRLETYSVWSVAAADI